MDQQNRDRSAKWIIIIGAVVVALLLIGFWSDWFGLYGIEQPPGSTVPEDAGSD